MNTRKAYRESWAKLRREIEFLSTHSEIDSGHWVHLIRWIAKNKERFPRNTKWPKARTVVEAFGHLPAKDFGEKYFTRVYHLASMVAESGRSKSERWILGQACGDLKKIAELKLTAVGIEPRRVLVQLSLFPKKTP
jgi:hypothetical protein